MIRDQSRDPLLKSDYKSDTLSTAPVGLARFLIVSIGASLNRHVSYCASGARPSYTAVEISTSSIARY